jgi:hypothetical protein
MLRHLPNRGSRLREKPITVRILPVRKTLPKRTTSQMKPVHVGILLGDLGDVNTIALKYLILHLNALQTYFEFEFLPTDRNDPTLVLTRIADHVDRDRLRAELPAFAQRVQASVRKLSHEYKLTQTAVPDRLILLTMARFSDQWYSVSAPGIRVLALGDWERGMAPPSLLEFFITLVLRQAVALVSPSLSGSVHFGTKGCLFDFTSTLDDVRYKALQGFVCSDCRATLTRDGHDQLADQLTPLLDTSQWFGKTEDPTAPAGIVANLGYDLFRTRGIKPSVSEKIGATLREEGVKELLKLIGGVILAALLLWLGLKQG